MAEMIPESQGSLRYIAVADPAAGDEFVLFQDLRVRWRVISVTAVMTTDANVADRFFNLDVRAGLNVLYFIPCREEGVASQVRNVSWYSAGGATFDAAHLVSVGTLPEKMLVNNGIAIRSVTQGIQTTDQWSDVYVIVEEWIEPLA